MRLFRNLLTAATLAAIFGVCALCMVRRSLGGEPVDTNKPAEPAKPQPATPEATPQGGKEGKGVTESERMHDIPVSAEHPAKGLKIPYFDNEGKLQMVFIIGIASRLDADHIDLSDMQVETFDEQSQHEMYIDLPRSVLDLNTSVISTQKNVTIRREDFILTGHTMEFNTKTKQGSLGGSVRMLIYNLDNPPPKPATESPTPPQPAASATPQPASVSTAP
jgi:Lipopolysaccharide-assembly, LptC-related